MVGQERRDQAFDETARFGVEHVVLTTAAGLNLGASGYCCCPKTFASCSR